MARDDAGFVQVMRGRVDDADGFRTFSRQPMDGLREMRPEIIGGTVAIADDGDFTQTIYFTSEAAAREGEKQEMPEEVQRDMEAGHGRDARPDLLRPARPLVRRPRLTRPRSR